MPQSGRQKLGYGFATGVTRDNSTIYIRNIDGDSWLVVENRLSQPLCVATVDPQSNQVTPVGMSIPPLTLTSVPIDPAKDVVLSIGQVAGLWTALGRVLGVNSPARVALTNTPRNVVWSTWQHGSMHSRDLYPLDTCLIVSRGTSLGTLGTTIHGLVGSDNVNLLASAAVAPFQNTPDPLDCAIVALAISILSLGAGVDSSQLICTPTTPVLGGQDVVLYGASAAAGNVPAIPPYPTPLPGVQDVQWTNNGPAAFSFVASYWVGIPAEMMY